jgi:hypothetical protein
MNKFTKEEIQQLIAGLELLEDKRFKDVLMDPPDAEKGVELIYEGFLMLALSLGNKRYQIDMTECNDCGGYIAHFSMWALGQLFKFECHYESGRAESILANLGLAELAESAIDVYQRRKAVARTEAMRRRINQRITGR